MIGTPWPPVRRVFLVGFMASGKTHVGRTLAALLGLPVVDLDAEIEAAAGRTIAELFAADIFRGDASAGRSDDSADLSAGEAAFRRLEATALATAAAGPPAVIATGGGAPCFGDNAERMRAAGLVVALTAPLSELLARAASDTAERPLLARGEDAVRALLEARQPAYRRAHVEVRTEGRTPAAIAERIEALLAATAPIPDDALATSALVGVDRAPYPVIVAPGGLDQLGEHLRSAFTGIPCRPRPTADSPSTPVSAPRTHRTVRAAVITDDNVAPLYGDRTLRSLAAIGLEPEIHVVPAGERAKSFAELERVVDALVAARLDRSSIVVALGGGVVGDLAGFVASGLFRGVMFVQVPTSLLAMIDAAIGGKTGIDTRAGKNLFGAFWQPQLVLADPDVLATLPARELRAAFGELVKYAVLEGEALYAHVEELADAVARDRATSAQLAQVVGRCATVKARIVARDEREQTGERALLNLGHTVGHAIEFASDYKMLHGEAVALGMIAACRVSANLGLCERTLAARVTDTLGRVGLETDLDPWLRPDVLRHVNVDKKRTRGAMRFIAIHRPGACAQVTLPIGEGADSGSGEPDDAAALLRILR